MKLKEIKKRFRLSQEDEKMLASKIGTKKDLEISYLKKLLVQGKKMEYRLELLETTHPQVAQIIREFWLPHKYDNLRVYKRMDEEIGIRIGSPKRIYKFLPVEEYTEEQAQQYAKEHKGEFLGKRETYYVVFMKPHTIKELREKYEV